MPKTLVDLIMTPSPTISSLLAKEFLREDHEDYYGLSEDQYTIPFNRNVRFTYTDNLNENGLSLYSEIIRKLIKGDTKAVIYGSSFVYFDGGRWVPNSNSSFYHESDKEEVRVLNNIYAYGSIWGAESRSSIIRMIGIFNEYYWCYTISDSLYICK